MSIMSDVKRWIDGYCKLWSLIYIYIFLLSITNNISDKNHCFNLIYQSFSLSSQIHLAK